MSNQRAERQKPKRYADAGSGLAALAGRLRVTFGRGGGFESDTRGTMARFVPTRGPTGELSEKWHGFLQRKSLIFHLVKTHFSASNAHRFENE
jgi:hypothetical protein